jgi:hypothetical protein
VFAQFIAWPGSRAAAGHRSSTRVSFALTAIVAVAIGVVSLVGPVAGAAGHVLDAGQHLLLFCHLG